MTISLLAADLGSRASTIARSIRSETALFGGHLYRLIKWDETLKTRFFIIEEIVGLAFVAHGAVLIGFGIAASCITNVEASKGFLLIVSGGLKFMYGCDLYRRSFSRVNYEITQRSLALSSN